MVVIEQLPALSKCTTLAIMGSKIPEKSMMIVRPKKPIAAKALKQVSSIVEKGVGVWAEMDSVVRDHPELAELRDGAIISMVGSKANNTLKTYLPYTEKWRLFAVKFGFSEYPAGSAQFILFVQELIQTAKDRKNKSGVVTTAVYAVDFIHQLMGLPKPGAKDAVKLMLAGAMKILARPTVRKSPLSMEVVKKLIQHFTPSLENYTLKGIRFSVYAALAFVLEARFADIIDVCPNNIMDYSDRMVVFLEEQKTDQYREGAFVPFMNTGEPLGAYALVSEILIRLPEGQEDQSIFRRVNTSKHKGEFFRGETMSYSLVTEGIKAGLKAIGENPKDYALHSFRSGAKSHVDKKQKGLPEGERIPVRLSNKHGRWNADSKAALGYTADDADDQLLVPKALGL